MLTIGLYYEVIEGKGQEFEEKFFSVVELMKTMPGHQSSDLYKKVNDPESYAIIGEWETQDDFLGFIRSDAFRDVTNWGLEAILRSRPRHKIYPKSEDMTRPS